MPLRGTKEDENNMSGETPDILVGHQSRPPKEVFSYPINTNVIDKLTRRARL